MGWGGWGLGGSLLEGGVANDDGGMGLMEMGRGRVLKEENVFGKYFKERVAGSSDVWRVLKFWLRKEGGRMFYVATRNRGISVLFLWTAILPGGCEVRLAERGEIGDI